MQNVDFDNPSPRKSTLQFLNESDSKQGSSSGEICNTNRATAQENKGIEETSERIQQPPSIIVQSQIYPYMWTVISAILGIDANSREKHGVISSTLNILTIGSALSECATYLIYETVKMQIKILFLSFNLCCLFLFTGSHDNNSSLVQWVRHHVKLNRD